MNNISLFLVGWLFGACCGVAFMAMRQTGVEIDERTRIIDELEKRERIIESQKALIKDLKRGQKR